MKQDEKKYDIATVLEKISGNLKRLLEQNNLNQKQFSEKIGISESTLSGYMKGSKSPGISFLISLKQLFPDISLEQFLFDEIEEQQTTNIPEDNLIPRTDYRKYKGSFYLFYLDTSNKTRSRTEKNVHETIDLKNGLIYVSTKPTASNTAAVRCIAVLGIKKRDEAQRIKNDIDLLDDYDRVYSYLKEIMPQSIYIGWLDISQMHIFISLNRVSDGKDTALILLHRASINREQYSGGLGTINSISTGRVSDPVVQLIALSKNYPYISDEEIKSQLWFSAPEVSVRGQSETKEILKLAEAINRSEVDEDSTPYNLFNEQNKKMLLQSYLEYLITKNIENNRLWFGRVSSTADDEWYHLLKESETYHEKQKQRNGDAEFEPSAYHSLC